MTTLLLIDANSLIHRAFHALPPLTTKGGEPAGALYGLTSMLLKVFEEKKPDYVAAAFDRPEPTFRKEMFQEYKAHRPKAPNELISQIIKAHELFERLGVAVFEIPGFEADDVIGTLAEKFKNSVEQIIILTGDRDALQLVEENRVVVETPQKGLSDSAIWNDSKVIEKYGVSPNQLVDYKGLVGDPSDNIPGVSGIGPKTATKLIQKYQTIEQMYKSIEPDSDLNQKLLENRESAELSKDLATIRRNVPITATIENLKNNFNLENTIQYLKELGFESIIKRLSGQPKDKKGAKEKNKQQGLF